MSVLKYTRKYLLYSLLALVVICGVGALVYSQIQKEQSRDHRDTFRPSSAQGRDTIASPPKTLWHKITPKLKKSPKTAHSHDTHDIDHIHFSGSSDQERSLPRDLKKRLDKVDSDNNSYYTNQNYFQEVYEAVSNGEDMETTIKLLKAYDIYTDVVLEHMDSYEAFKYILYSAPTDRKSPAKEFAKRIINNNPSSPEALESWLYLERITKSAQEDETYLRDALKYHPNSIEALYGLGRLLSLDQPVSAVPYLKSASDLKDSANINSELGVAYERLGDYKTAWVYYKKALNYNPNHLCHLNLEAIVNGEPNLSPVNRETFADAIIQSDALPLQNPVDVPLIPNSDVFVDAFVMPEDVPVSPQDPDIPSPEALSRQGAEHQAFLEMLQEQDEFTRRLVEDEAFREEYFKELDEFINWSESIMNDAPIDTNNFLSKEMERHLSGKKTTYAPDRLKRGFEFLKIYGEDEGIKRLQKLDPSLAKEVTQQFKQKRVPRPRNPRDK